MGHLFVVRRKEKGAHYQDFELAILINALPSKTAGGYISFLATHLLNGSCLDRSEKGIYG